jgi:hypothetical protein
MQRQTLVQNEMRSQRGTHTQQTQVKRGTHALQTQMLWGTHTRQTQMKRGTHAVQTQMQRGMETQVQRPTPAWIQKTWRSTEGYRSVEKNWLEVITKAKEKNAVLGQMRIHDHRQE